MNKLIDYLKARIINNMLWVFTLIIIIAIGVHFIVKISDYFASGRQDKLKAKTEKFYKVVSLDSLNNRFDSITATKCDSTAKYYLSRVKSRKNEKEIARIEFYAPKDTSCEYNLKNCAKYASILEADNSDLSIAADTLKASGVKKDAIIDRLGNNLNQSKKLINDWQTIATKPKPKLATFGTIGYNTFNQASAGLGLFYGNTGLEVKAITNFKANGVEASIIYRPFY